MFMEGLGANSLRWVRKESGFKPNSVLNHGSEAGVVYNLKKGGGGLAVPPPAKFLNEHLSTGVTPASRVRLVSRNGNESGSDMDLSSDSEVEISGDNGANFQRGIRTINGTFPRNVRMTSQQDFCGRLQNKKHFDDRIPTAPPFVGSAPEVRTDHIDVNSSVISLPSRLPTFHASQKGSWHALIAYESCVRLCLHSWAQDHCMEAPYFLNDECCLLRDAFGLRKVLLQPEEELLAKQSSEIVSLKAAPFIRKTNCKMKVQVRKVNMGLDSPTSCSCSSVKPPNLSSLHISITKLKRAVYSAWEAVREVHIGHHVPANSSFSSQGLAFMHSSSQYIKQVSRHLKNAMTTLCNRTSKEAMQETYSCLLRLKSSSDIDAVRMQSGCPETRIFLPDSLGDDLIIEIQDSNGQYLGRVVVQVAVLADEPSHRLRWWPIYHERQHDLIGRLQLHMDYSTSSDDSHHLKCGSVAETVAYDHVLEVAMEVQHFQQRNLLLYGPWKWLVAKFASYYGVSDTYTKLRYLSYVMDVATPTEDCLSVVHDLLSAVLMKGNRKRAFSHQENRILGEIEDQVDQILALVFENYKSLDESSPSGMKDVFEAATGIAAPALAPAFRLYTLLHDTSSSEEQFKLCRYLQSAVKKRSRRHLLETDDFIFSCKGGTLTDPVTLSDSYQKMITLILSFRNEIFTDIEICNQPVLPSFIDLPNLSSSIYSVDLSSRLREFLIACPPPGPSPPVVELLLATADLQRDLVGLNISPIKNGVDAKELFHSYINIWIQDKRLDLLESCKVDKAKCSGVKTQHSTTPFVEDMYDQLEETLKEYEIIIFRWPEYINVLENAIADVEKAILEALDRQYADVLSPLKDVMSPKLFGFKYVPKISKRCVNIYFVPEKLGVLLNSLKRMLDVLQPKIETHLTSWSSSISTDGNAIIGEHLSEVAVMLRATFRNYLQAIEEKLAENTRLQSATKLNKIIEDLKETVTESDIRSRMQPLKDLVIQTIDQLHTVVSPHVFIAICRRFWNHMGQELLHYLENRPEESSWYKGLRIALDTLDKIFTSEMQKLIGNALQTRDLEQPRFIMQLHSMLSKDAVNYKDNNYYY